MLLKNTINELIKIIAKPRSYIGFGALTLLIGVILLAMKADGKSFISFVTASFEQTLSFNGEILNGNLMAFIILRVLKYMISHTIRIISLTIQKEEWLIEMPKLVAVPLVTITT